jgi:cytochrome c oxidase cbb3-type subunit 3
MGLRALTAAAALPAALLIGGGAASCGGPGGGGSTDGTRVASAAPASVRSDLHVFAGGIAPAADRLTNPLQANREAAAAGERLFASMNCDGCHGGGATGFVAPSLVDGRWRYGGDDGALYHSIFYGRPRGMPAYGGLLAPNTIWQLVAYLRAQPVPGVVPTQGWR